MRASPKPQPMTVSNPPAPYVFLCFMDISGEQLPHKMTPDKRGSKCWGLMSCRLLSISLGGRYFPTEPFTRLGHGSMGDRPVTNPHFCWTHPHATSPQFFTLKMNFRDHFTARGLGQGSFVLLCGHKARLCVSAFFSSFAFQVNFWTPFKALHCKLKH